MSNVVKTAVGDVPGNVIEAVFIDRLHLGDSLSDQSISSDREAISSDAGDSLVLLASRDRSAAFVASQLEVSGIVRCAKSRYIRVQIEELAAILGGNAGWSKSADQG